MSASNIFRYETDSSTFLAGDVVFRAGDPGDVMYAVLDGQIDILVGDRVIDSITTGGIFGEMALIDKSPRSATAIARTASRILPINEKRFLFLVQQTPYFSLEVMKIMADRLRNFMRASP